jgi:steroid delta-isomerase-like uncharacterized protein
VSDLKTTMSHIYEEVFNQGRYDVVDELFADDFTEHESLPPGIPPGKEAPRELTAMMRRAFPDFHADIEDMLQEGDKVVTRLRFSGTHRGEFMGAPPTGQGFDIDVIDIVEFRDGRAIAHWGVMDVAAMMGQLGVGAPPA